MARIETRNGVDWIIEDNGAEHPAGDCAAGTEAVESEAQQIKSNQLAIMAGLADFFELMGGGA